MSIGLDRNDQKRFRVSRYVPNQAKVYTYHWFALTKLAPAARVCGKKRKKKRHAGNLTASGKRIGNVIT